MVLNQQIRAGSNECGTANKCVVCNMRFICAHSPYCCVHDKKDSENVDLTPINEKLSDLSDKVQYQSQAFPIIGNAIDGINAKIESLNSGLEKLSELVQIIRDDIKTFNSESSDKLSDILNKVNEKSDNMYNVSEEINSELVPYNTESNNNDTVLVEKKNLFGKTKWVEEKKK